MMCLNGIDLQNENYIQFDYFDNYIKQALPGLKAFWSTTIKDKSLYILTEFTTKDKLENKFKEQWFASSNQRVTSCITLKAHLVV